MCVSPITVRIERKNYLGLYKSQVILASRGFPRDYVKRDLTIEVPCGKCAECLARKRKCLEARFLRESMANPLLHFVTLTYRPAKLPMSLYFGQVTKDTGEFVKCQDNVVIAPRFNKESVGPFLDGVRNELTSKFKSYKNPKGISYLQREVYEDEEDLLVMRATPSLCRRDVRLWLKRCRVRYERSFGEKMADFRYYIIGEHGYNTDRPHYHACFFGLPRRQLDFMTGEWNRDFGFTKTETVYVKNEDGSNAFLLVAKYVAKYITKGSCESSCVLSGDVEKPRVMCSLQFGLGRSLDVLRNYFLCTSKFGVYDPDSLRFADGSLLSHDQIGFLADYISRHLYLEIDGFKYPIPSTVRRRIFGVYESYIDRYGQKKERFKHYSTLYRLVMEFARSNIVADYYRGAPKFGAYKDSADFSKALSAFFASKESFAKTKASAMQKADIVYYQNSKV